MAQSRQKFAFARCGASVALAATLSLSMVPATALAEVDSDAQGGAVAAAAADIVQTPDGFYVEKGKAYAQKLTWLNETGKDMLEGAFGTNVSAVFDGSSWNVTFTASGEMGSFVEWVKVGDNQQSGVAADGGKTYTFSTSKLSDMAEVTMLVNMGPMQREVSSGITISTDGLSTTDPEPEPAPEPEPGDDDALVAGVAYAVPLDLGGSMAGNMLGKNAIVTKAEDGTYTVVITVAASDTYYFEGLTVGGVQATRAYSTDGANYVFTAEGVSAISGEVKLGFTYTPYGMWRTMNHSANATFDTGSATTEGATAPEVQTGVVKTDLNNTIAAAKEIQQGSKTAEAYETLQAAISTAEKAAGNDMIPQMGIDANVKTLIEAIQTFNASPDASTDPEQPGEEDGDAVETPDGFLLVQGQEYTVPVKLVKDDGSDSMAAGYFEAEGTVVWTGSAYQVTFRITSDGQQFITSIDGVENLGGGAYRATVDSIVKPVTLKFGLTVPGAGSMNQTGYLQIDTTTLPTKSGEQIKPENPSTPPSENNNNNQNNTGNEVTEKFQVGHTYQVPIAFLKHNSSETSMAAQYLGDTALVRPQENGTFQVSFAATSEGLGYIKSLSYNGSAIAQSGNQFTLSIPAAESDVVIPIEMAITMMQQLGIGQSQTADMHLYLSQAKDLGTGQASLAASSSNLAQTGDSTTGAATLAVGAVAAGIAVAATARRRLSQQD